MKRVLEQYKVGFLKLHNELQGAVNNHAKGIGDVIDGHAIARFVRQAQTQMTLTPTFFYKLPGQRIVGRPQYNYTAGVLSRINRTLVEMKNSVYQRDYNFLSTDLDVGFIKRLVSLSKEAANRFYYAARIR